MKAKSGVTPAQMKKIALSFPEANEKPSYGRPAYFIAKKFFTRLRAEDNSIVMIVDGIDSRDMMLELDPKTYHITDHYKDYPAVLVRMERITPDELKLMLERRWRHIAPKKLIKEIDEKQTLSSPASARSSRVRGKGTQVVKLRKPRK
ncbi:MAG TPA: hypothetical protein VGG48_12705 [Rhizomicrobium sp.]